MVKLVIFLTISRHDVDTLVIVNNPVLGQCWGRFCRLRVSLGKGWETCEIAPEISLTELVGTYLLCIKNVNWIYMYYINIQLSAIVSFQQWQIWRAADQQLSLGPLPRKSTHGPSFQKNYIIQTLFLSVLLYLARFLVNYLLIFPEKKWAPQNVCHLGLFS